MTIKLSSLHSHFASYATLLCAKLETETHGQTFPERNRKELSALYQTLVVELHGGIELEAQVSLLGHPAIIDEFRKYWLSLSKAPQDFAPGDNTYAYSDVTRKMESLSEKRRAILQHLSKVFLLG